MDLGKLFKNIKDITEYCTITKDLMNKHGNSKIQFNMSTVLSLKKIRSFEVEYYEKYEKNGAGFILFERLFQNQPSKTWKLLGRDMVSILLYWLEAAKRHLDSHNTVWWPFIKSLLNLIKDIRLKDLSLPKVLVEEMSDCLLRLATDGQLDAMQSYEVLGCFNLFSAMASREIRFALREQLDKYFLKLATTLATCGHFPTQFNIMETLLRWLLLRQDPAVRRAAADAWFRAPLYRDTTVAVFLERTFQNFFQDARDFLNAHNRGGGLVTSVVCKRLTIDGHLLVSGTDRCASWLDINATSRSVSLMLDPRMMMSIGVPEQPACDALVVRADTTRSVRMHRVCSEVVVSLCTSEPVRLQAAGAVGGTRVQLALGSRADAAAAHPALGAVFGDKYQMKLDSLTSTSNSPPQRVPESGVKKFSGSEEDTTFANPAQVKRRKRSGFCARPTFPASLKSPSTTSTTSLAQLHEKLAALPRFAFDKELTSVCSRPELSVVNELSEIDEPSSCNDTFVNTRRRAYGVSKKKSQKKGSQSDGDVEDKTIKRKFVSPVLQDECSTSCLLFATIGSDESVINDTIDRLSKRKDFNTDNIVDLLLQEALQAKTDEILLDSGINTFENVKKTQKVPEVNTLMETNSEVIENTPLVEGIDKVISKKPDTETNLRKVSTSRDESNLNESEISTNFVNVTKRNIQNQHDSVCKKVNAERTLDIHDAEDFFSQHFANNKESDVAISPTLAKKLNETSSEDSCSFDQPLKSIYKNQQVTKNLFEVDEIAIIACLNSVVDKVCEDFDKCTKYLDIENNASNFLGIPINIENELREDADTVEHNQTNENIKLRKCKSIKLKYKTAMKKESLTKKRNASKRDKKKNVPDMPLTTAAIHNIDLIENANEEIGTKKQSKIVKESTNQQKTASVSKKRKLFSPKQQHLNMNKDVVHIPETEDDDTTHSDLKTIKNITPKSHATSYKELEKACRQRIRLPRSKKSKAQTVVSSSVSPRTKKMNTIFDKLKEDVDYKEKTTHASGITDEHDLAVYNFTSDSEDEDFKKKTLKRTSTTTLASGGSNASKRGRKTNSVNYNESKYSSADENKDKINTGKRKKSVKRKTPKKKERKAIIDNINNTMVDERMRGAAMDDLNRSLVVEEPKETTITDPEPKIIDKHQMEVICDDHDLHKESDYKSEVAQRTKNRKILSIKKEKNIKTKAKLDIIKGYDDERSGSPLPSLVVEKVPTRIDDANDSLKVNMTQKFQKIYRDGPDACINDINTTKNFLSDSERIRCSPRDRNAVDLCDLTKEFSGTRKHVKSIGIYTKPYDDDGEVINICEMNENTSEKSIATIGDVLITAHGDSDEPPPDQEMINKTILSRDLEKENMDESCLDFYNVLTKQISKKSSNSEGEERIANSTNARKVLSRQASDRRSDKASTPVVSLARLSADDIRKWLSSRRSTETSKSNISNENHPIVKEKEIEAQKSQVILLIKGLSSDEFTKFLPSLRNVAPDFESQNSEQVSSNNKENKSTSVIKCNDTKKIREEIDVSNSKIARRSIISPIKLSNESETPTRSNVEVKLSDTEDCAKERKHMKPNLDGSRNKENESTELKEMANISGSKGYNLRSLRTADHSTTATKTSRTNKTEDETTSNRLTHKRKSSPDKEVSKKLRAATPQDAASVTGSCLSVDEWLRRDAPASSAEAKINTFVTDVVQNVLEKVDTSMEEINQNTSRQLVSMFVNTREQLMRFDDEHLKMCRSTASDILKGVVSIIDDSFAQLHKRTQELRTQFEDDFKRQATEVVRNDMKQKRAAVVLLREDVQAAAEHMKQTLARDRDRARRCREVLD